LLEWYATTHLDLFGACSWAEVSNDAILGNDKEDRRAHLH
jgi:hypothetical protein